MTKSRLLQAVCAVAMLAAVPALAQRPDAGMPGANGAPNPAAARPDSTANQKAAQNNSGGMAPANDGTNMSPANNGGTGSSASATESHSTHRSAMAHPSRAMRGRSDTSQDAAVDRLNEQSYQSAQQGQPFSAGGSDSSPNGMATQGGRSTSGSSGGAMPGGTMQGGAMQGGAMPGSDSGK
ncbi:MAG: hypothetical protein JWQ55_2211 [Rhodopila sp.]|nr:hypothetical protein [Rhodopila sp.]